MEILDLRKAKVPRGFGNHLVPSHFIENGGCLLASVSHVARGGSQVSMLGLASLPCPFTERQEPLWMVGAARLHMRRRGWQHKHQGRSRADAVAPGPAGTAFSSLPSPSLASLRHTPRRPGMAWPNGGGVAQKCSTFLENRPTRPLCLTDELFRVVLGSVGATEQTSETRSYREVHH